MRPELLSLSLLDRAFRWYGCLGAVLCKFNGEPLFHGFLDVCCLSLFLHFLFLLLGVRLSEGLGGLDLLAFDLGANLLLLVILALRGLLSFFLGLLDGAVLPCDGVFLLLLGRYPSRLLSCLLSIAVAHVGNRLSHVHGVDPRRLLLLGFELCVSDSLAFRLLGGFASLDLLSSLLVGFLQLTQLLGLLSGDLCPGLCLLLFLFLLVGNLLAFGLFLQLLLLLRDELGLLLLDECLELSLLGSENFLLQRCLLPVILCFLFSREPGLFFLALLLCQSFFTSLSLFLGLLLVFGEIALPLELLFVLLGLELCQSDLLLLQGQLGLFLFCSLGLRLRLDLLELQLSLGLDLAPLVGIALLDLCLCFGFRLCLDANLFELELALSLLGLLLVELFLSLTTGFFVGFVGLDLKHFVMKLLDLLKLGFEPLQEFLTLVGLLFERLGTLDELFDGVVHLLLQAFHIFLHGLLVHLFLLLLFLILLRMCLAPDCLIVVLCLLQLLIGVFVDLFLLLAQGLRLLSSRLRRHLLRELIKERLVLLADSCVPDLLLQRLLLLDQGFDAVILLLGDDVLIIESDVLLGLYLVNVVKPHTVALVEQNWVGDEFVDVV